MATSCDYFCDICHGRHLKTLAENWCSECEECFCKECLVHHSISKLSKDHEVISITNYKKLPLSVSKLTQHCDEHQKQYHLYCPNHDSLCCAACTVTTHKDCSGIVVIDDVIKNTKTSTLLETMEQTLTSIEQNFEKVSEDRKQNIKNILEQKQRFCDQIKLSRTKINSHLDELERKMVDEMDTEEEKVTKQIEDLLKSLAEKRKEVEELKQSLLAVKSYASKLQAFLGSTVLEKDVEKIESSCSLYPKTVYYDRFISTMTLMGIYYNVNICSTESYGSVSVEVGAPSLIFNAENH